MAYWALAKLAPFPTVLLSALEQSPFGTAGCHGTCFILPTGTLLERGDSSVWRETSGHEKVQCSLLKLKHSESKFRIQGGAGGRQQEDDDVAFFHLKRDCFRAFQEELGTLTEPPWERQEWRECSEIVQNRKKLHATAGLFVSLVWKRFASHSQGKKTQIGGKVFLCWGRIPSHDTLPLVTGYKSLHRQSHQNKSCFHFPLLTSSKLYTKCKFDN